MHQHVTRLRAAIGTSEGHHCLLFLCHQSVPDRHTMRFCIVEDVVLMSICLAMAVTLMPDRNTGPEVLALKSTTQCAAVTTNEVLTIVPQHRPEDDSESIESRTWNGNCWTYTHTHVLDDEKGKRNTANWNSSQKWLQYHPQFLDQRELRGVAERGGSKLNLIFNFKYWFRLR